MNTAEVHTIEHLGATFLRNHPVNWKDTHGLFWTDGLPNRLLSPAWQVIIHQKDVVGAGEPSCLTFVRDFEGEVPGSKLRRTAANYLDMNLPMAALSWKEIFGAGFIQY